MIGMNKRYETRNGAKVRLYCTDGGGSFPIHGAIYDEIGKKWITAQWNEYGNKCGEGGSSKYSLVEVKDRIKLTKWVNVYPDGSIGFPNDTKEEAKGRTNFGKKKFACVEIIIDCAEGEGL